MDKSGMGNDHTDNSYFPNNRNDWLWYWEGACAGAVVTMIVFLIFFSLME